MSHSTSPLPNRGWRRNLALGIFFVGVAIFILGSVSFYLADTGANLVFRVGHALYAGAQLVLLHFDAKPDEAIALPLEIVRLLAPLVLGSTALLTLYELFRNPIRLWILSRRGNHVVVCGLNEQNLHVISKLRGRGDSVVVIDMNPVNELLSSAEEVGAITLTGDATTANMLRKAVVDRAKYLIIREADDGRNVQIGLGAIPVRTQRGRPGSAALHCFLHLTHLDLRHLFRQHGVLAKKNDQIVLHLFTTYENSARILFKNCPLEPFKFGPDDPRSVHLVIIGFGQMGESVALQAAKIGHFANGRKLRLTVIDRRAKARKELLYTYCPYFAEVCDAEFIEGEAEDPALAAKMVNWSEDAGSITTFAICFDDDARSLAFALRLMRRIDRRASIRVRMASSAGLATLIHRETGSPEIPRDLTAFGGLNEANEVELIIEEELDSQAKAIHEDFVERRMREGDRPEKNSALVPWNRLGDDFVESNRQQADHIKIKLSAIGCYSSPPKNETPYQFSEKGEIELLARMEHARWLAERRLAGWEFSPGEKDEKRKTSPYLVEWAQLEEKVKDYDRQAVRDIPRFLALINERIYQ
jgi:hypothetical protein